MSIHKLSLHLFIHFIYSYTACLLVNYHPIYSYTACPFLHHHSNQYKHLYSSNNLYSYIPNTPISISSSISTHPYISEALQTLYGN